MRFENIETGLNFELIQIPNTDFWSDKDGDLYLATHGTCERISGLNAVTSLLKRENMKTVAQVVCHEQFVPERLDKIHPQNCQCKHCGYFNEKWDSLKK